MQEDVPLLLFFDTSIAIVPGQVDVIRWGVLNRFSVAITDLRIELTCANREAIQAYECTLPGRLIKPGICGVFGQSLKVSSGVRRLPIEVHLAGILEDGSHFELVSLYTPIFTFADPEKVCRSIEIEIGQEGIVKNLGDYYDQVKIKVGSSGILDLDRSALQGQPLPCANLDSTGTGIDPNSLHQIPLAQKDNAGLTPLDLELFARSWRGRRGLTLHFVDEQRRPRGQSAKEGDLYSLQVAAQCSGYITLLARGTSGRHYMFAPNSSKTPEAFFIHPGGSCFLPGELLPLPLPAWPDMDILKFTDAGVELAVVLLTPRPLLEKSVDFACTEYAPGAVVELLRVASAMPDASLAMARIVVEKRGVPWG